MPDGPFITEAKKRMPGLTDQSGYFDTCEAVSTFLKDINQTLSILTALNHDMAWEITRRRGAAILWKNRAAILTALGQTQSERTEVMNKLVSHVLSNVLSINEQDKGFTLYKRQGSLWSDSPVTYLGFIDGPTFQRQIEEGKTFKDPTVPGTHGEFTHRIQWYMIMNNTIEEPAKGWAEFYKWVGAQRHTQPFGRTERVNFGYKDFILKQGLWDAMVDRVKNGDTDPAYPYKAESETDFRSPEQLHEYLIKNENAVHFDLLQTFLADRHNKRQSIAIADRETDKAKWLAIGNYCARKFHGAALKYLSEDQAKNIANRLTMGDANLLIFNPQNDRDVVNATVVTEGEKWFCDVISRYKGSLT